MNNKKVLMAELYPLIADIIENDGEATFQVSGISMQPMLYNKRDTVTLVKAKLPLKKYDLPFYLLDDGRFILHRVIKIHPDGTYECRGDNCWISEDNIRDDQIIGIVKSFTRNGKTVDVNKSIGYWIYTRTWKFFHLLKKFYKYPVNMKRSLLKLVKYLKDVYKPEKAQLKRSDGKVYTISYRKAYKTDIEQLQKIMLRHAEHEAKEFEDDVINSSWPMSKNGKTFLEKFIDKNFIYLAFCDNKVIGYIRGRVSETNFENFPIGKCQGIFVDSAYRGLGIGTKLLNELKKYCLENKCNHLKIEFLDDNDGAARLYERNGFKPYAHVLMCEIKETKI